MKCRPPSSNVKTVWWSLVTKLLKVTHWCQHVQCYGRGPQVKHHHYLVHKIPLLVSTSTLCSGYFDVSVPTEYSQTMLYSVPIYYLQYHYHQKGKKIHWKRHLEGHTHKPGIHTFTNKQKGENGISIFSLRLFVNVCPHVQQQGSTAFHLSLIILEELYVWLFPQGEVYHTHREVTENL